MMTLPSNLQALHELTKSHRASHGCGAYTFNDGEGLLQVAHERQPKRILELGCALGFTAACMAFGSPDALIDTIEADSLHVRLAREQLNQLGLSERVRVHQGYFDDVLPQLTEPYDLIFFDGYEPCMSLLEQLRHRLNPNGTLVCANLKLASGRASQSMHEHLSNPALWDTEFRLENGTTAVSIKRGG